MVGFMATATVVLAAVLLTYPNGGPSCTPSTAQQATVTTPDQTTGYDSRFEDVGPVTDASAAGPTHCSEHTASALSAFVFPLALWPSQLPGLDSNQQPFG